MLQRDETINKQYGHMSLSLVYYFVLAETLRGTSSRTMVVFHSKMFNALSIFSLNTQTFGAV